MIIRPKQSRKKTFIERVFKTEPNLNDNFGIFSTGRFEFELAKEAARANRRELNDRSFSVVTITATEGADENSLLQFFEGFRGGLRISDSIGWLNDQLAILLPETDSDGAAQVANELTKLAAEYDIVLDTSIMEYPKDDMLVSRANTLIEELADKGKDVDREAAGGNPEEADQAKPGRSNASRMQGDRRQQFVRFSRPFGKSFRTPLWKRGIDVLFSGSGLVALSPLFLLTAIAIKRDSKGPVFFKQRREGKDGNVFEIWKFRTMRVDAEELKDKLREQSEQDGPAFKLKNDPRLTIIGKYLRKSCIDELPQLINVFRGDMSLVGPRPLPVDESVQCCDWQRNRLRVLPGITCIWQAEGGRDIPFDEWMRMDLRYLKKRSFLYDLKMIFKTVFIAVLHKGSV